MKRAMRWLTMAGALAMVSLTGCGSNSSSGSDLAALIVGTWVRTQESTDGGATYVPQNDNYQFSFSNSGTWADNRSRSGTYVLIGNQCTLYIGNAVNNRVTISMFASNDGMRFIFFSDNAFVTPTGRIQIYQRT